MIYLIVYKLLYIISNFHINFRQPTKALKDYKHLVQIECRIIPRIPRREKTREVFLNCCMEHATDVGNGEWPDS